jgi:phosphate-selective porin
MCDVRAAIVAIGLVLLLPSRVAAQSGPAPSQDPEREGTGIYWRNRPSIQLGQHVRLDLRLRLQFDWRDFDPEIGEDTYDFRARRAGVNGEIASHVEFQVERDLNRDGRWRDVFVNWRTFRQFEVIAGRFKVPFGREQSISSTEIDFAFRTLASSIIPPARENGVMAHGRFLRRGFTYEVGVFDGDGDNGRLEEAQFAREREEPEGMGTSFAGRVTATPLRPLAETFDTLRLGVAYGTVTVPEGLNSLRGESAWGTFDYVEPVYVQGRRQRIGLEFSYTPGPLGFGAEWMRAREERDNQGLGDIDLSDFLSTGWYASATWLLTGEDKADFNNPRRPLFAEGIGAIEIGARYEQLSFESAGKEGPAFANPRADHYLGNTDSIWTFGVNWYATRWTRLLVNAMHEKFDDAARTPLAGQTDFWSGVFRLQVAF